MRSPTMGNKFLIDVRDKNVLYLTWVDCRSLRIKKLLLFLFHCHVATFTMIINVWSGSIMKSEMNFYLISYEILLLLQHYCSTFDLFQEFFMRICVAEKREELNAHLRWKPEMRKKYLQFSTFFWSAESLNLEKFICSGLNDRQRETTNIKTI